MSENITSKKPGVMHTFFRLLPMVFKSAPTLFAISNLFNILHGFSWGILALFRQRFFDSASALATGGSLAYRTAADLMTWGLVITACQVLNGVGNFLPGRFVDKSSGGLSLLLQQKVARIPAVSFENPAILDELNKAREGQKSAGWLVFDIMIIPTFYIPYFILMALYLYSLKPVLVWAVLIVFIPTAMTQIVRTKILSRYEDDAAPIRRKQEYYEKCIADREYFKETRLLGAFAFFRGLYRDSLLLASKLRLRAENRSNLYELSMKLITVAGYLSIVYLLFDALMKQEISMGAFAAVTASIDALFGLMEEAVCMHMTEISKGLGTSSNLLMFLDLPERGGGLLLPTNGEIHAENISFSYPGSDKKAVNGVSLEIKSGETVAVVGENGSGKTTLVRLLTGIYIPNEGEVLIGGSDTRLASQEALFSKTSAVFQHYQHYKMTLRDNISISDVVENSDDEILDEKAVLADMNISADSFPAKYDTLLSREFGGTELSVGQWQRVAIARGLFRSHEIIVLDEPTAAIDPVEESRIYERFAALSKGKTAIIVTHRLGSVRMVDRILMLKDGRLIEEGKHDDLVAVGGAYAKMYHSQEEMYSNN